MTETKHLREHLLELLDGKSAHVDLASALRDFPVKAINTAPANSPHTAWQLLEHIRIAQWDILEFSRNSKHVSPKWPDGYWPQSSAPADEEAWKKSIAAFRRDLEEVKKLVSQGDEQQLCARIPHGDGQTLLREALLVADHNSYHLGQLVMLRKMFGAWK